MQHTLTEKVVLTVQDCITCGVKFAMPDALDRQLQSSGESFYCPNGHRQCYSENDAIRLKRERQRREEAERKAANALEDARIARANTEQERRSHAHTKGELTKTKKKITRVQNGVCPHCKRSFPNLHDHMLSKHGTAAEAKTVADQHQHEAAHGD